MARRLLDVVGKGLTLEKFKFAIYLAGEGASVGPPHERASAEEGPPGWRSGSSS
jgi:hypothetical protein